MSRTSTFLFVAFLLLAGVISGQAQKQSRRYCSYGEGNSGPEICAAIRNNSFASNEQAQGIVDGILAPLGLRSNFVLVSCPQINNAMAYIHDDGYRYIIYDNEFMESIDRTAGTDWAAISILAHEIGHHLQAHTLGRERDLRARREDELEADEFSGFVMFRLGATLAQAQAAMNSLPDVRDEENSTHPARARRLQAIRVGYDKARSQSPESGGQTTESQGGLSLSPPAGDGVGLAASLTGRTTLTGWNHYLVVASTRDRRFFIQPGLVQSPNGGVFGTAAFGTESYGIGHDWSVRLFATRTSIPAGEIFAFPPDAVFSNEVIVRRTR